MSKARGPGLNLKPPKTVKGTGPGINSVTGARMTPAGSSPGGNPLATKLPTGFGTAANVSQPLPFDATYDSQVGLNTRNYNDTITGLDAQGQQTLRDFGLDDPSDPFSRAKALERAYHQRETGTTNSMAARGQLYSGANQSAHDSNTYGFLAGTDALRKEQNNVLGLIERKRQQAGSARDQGNIDALSASTDRAVNTPVNPLDVPAPKAPNKPRRFASKRIAKKGTKFS